MRVASAIRGARCVAEVVRVFGLDAGDELAKHHEHDHAGEEARQCELRKPLIDLPCRRRKGSS